jgi:hypothetical protein
MVVGGGGIEPITWHSLDRANAVHLLEEQTL